MERTPRWLVGIGWLVLVWWTIRSGLRGQWIFLDFVNLAFHEAGHVLLAFAGTTVRYLGGTLGQLLVPALLVPYFLLRQGQPLGAAFCLWWAGQSVAQVATYMADARELALPLVGGGDHDWNELFYRFGVLEEPLVARIAGLTRTTGAIVMLAGLAWTGRLVLMTARRAVDDGAYPVRAITGSPPQSAGRRGSRPTERANPRRAPRGSSSLLR